MILPVTKRFSKYDTTLIERLIPSGAVLSVSEGEEVKPETILAEGQVSAGQRLISVAEILGVNKSRVGEYLTKKIGEKIFKNEVLAMKKGPLGFGKRVVSSPIDGQIVSVTSDGSLLIKFLPEAVKVVSASRGKVSAVKGSSIIIETWVQKAYGVAGTGKLREGIIKVVAQPQEFILEGAIDESCADKILVGGASIGRDALEKALKLGVKGIVTGGINYKEFLSFGIESDVGFTLVVTEGFGILPMGEDIFNPIKQTQGYFGFIDGKNFNLSIPILTEERAEKNADKFKWVEAKIGDQVQFFNEQKRKMTGTIVSLADLEEISEYGLKTKLGVVELDGKQITMPLANLEVVFTT